MEPFISDIFWHYYSTLCKFFKTPSEAFSLVIWNSSSIQIWQSREKVKVSIWFWTHFILNFSRSFLDLKQGKNKKLQESGSTESLYLEEAFERISGWILQKYFLANFIDYNSKQKASLHSIRATVNSSLRVIFPLETEALLQYCFLGNGQKLAASGMLVNVHAMLTIRLWSITLQKAVTVKSFKIPRNFISIFFCFKIVILTCIETKENTTKNLENLEASFAATFY